MSAPPAPSASRRRFDGRTLLYNLGLAAGAPLLLGYLLWRLLRGKSREGLRERLGWLPPELRALGAAEDPVIWIHCASVGEVNAAAPVLRELRVRLPLAHMVLSTITPAGQAMAAKRDLGLDGVFYCPFDLPFTVEAVMQQLRPRVLVLLESELWPNLLALARRHGVRTIIVNARISDRAFPKNRFFKPVYRWVLSNVDAIGAQSEVDAERFRFLGAPAERVTIGGNSKFDDTPVPLAPAEAARWRQEFGFADADEVLLAGSTHDGEEEIILTVFDQLRFSHKHLQLIICPRHPVRGDQVHQLVQSHGYDVYRRSHVLQARERGEEIGAPRGPAVRVVILDTVGELASLYGCADLVIVGGSLRKGLAGHNILEPIAQGKLTLFGPHMADFRDISALALREGCGVQVQDAQHLLSECARLLEVPDMRLHAAERGRAMVAKYAGASARYADAIERLAHAAETAPDASAPAEG
jgi:3-deoxy-D-manno-octulosonic-acid transferase